MPWNDGLTGAALNIAATDETPLRVMAGPGTGKSFAMKRRVVRFLEQNVSPRRVVAVTFTRNAAASLIEDLHALGVAGWSPCFRGTPSSNILAAVAGGGVRPLTHGLTDSEVAEITENGL